MGFTALTFQVGGLPVKHEKELHWYTKSICFIKCGVAIDSDDLKIITEPSLGKTITFWQRKIVWRNKEKIHASSHKK